MKRILSIPLIALALVFVPLVGCTTTSSNQVTAREYAQPRETIRAAQAMGASRVPRAQLYLSYAKDSVDQADQALDNGKNYQARLALARAQADANLALTMAKERQMVQQVRQIQQRIQQLDQQAQ